MGGGGKMKEAIRESEGGRWRYINVAPFVDLTCRGKVNKESDSDLLTPY